MAEARSDLPRWIRRDWLLVAGLAGLALILRIVAGPRTIDDAYITFRYARNLAEGLGFVYNPGQRVLGTTTPLYTALMSVSWLLGQRALPSVALWLNSLADAGSVALLYWMGRRLSGSRVAATGVALAWAVSPMSVTFAGGGMETSVVILFLVASFAAYVAGRSRLSAGLMALAVLTRPDALIAGGLLFADMVLRPLLARDGSRLGPRLRRLPWVEVAIFGAILAPWILFATAYFGSPLPQSVQAKVRAYHLEPFEALIRLLQHVSTPFFEHEVFGRYWPAVGFPLYAVLYLAGGLGQVRRMGRSVPHVLYPLAYVVVFSAANPLIFRWYLAPLLPCYVMGIVLGLHGILSNLAQKLDRARAGEWATGLVVALLLLSSLNAYTLAPDHGLDRPAPEMAWYRLELLYRQAAELVKARMEPGDVVAAGDIGAVGWLTDAPILDTVGLISSEALPYYPLDPSMIVANSAMSPDLIRDLQPDYIITLEVYVRNTLLTADWFPEQYRLLRKLEADVYGSDGMLVFERIP